MHRLRGEFAAAEEAYRSASQWGLEPQPGLALLRLAQGRTDAAAAAIRRAVGATADRLQRTKLLPAHIEIMLAAGDVQEARGACHELEEIAGTFDTGVLGAMAAYARGAVELAEGNPHAALGSLRCAFEVWQQVEAPYAAARVRVLIGLACRALGDDDGGGLELDAARAVFEQLGAAPDLARIDALIQGAPSAHRHGLTRRELQVLRLVAAGKTNKAIAAELCLSEKTIDRHVSNIFTKLDVAFARRGHRLRVRARAHLIRRKPAGRPGWHHPRGVRGTRSRLVMTRPSRPCTRGRQTKACALPVWTRFLDVAARLSRCEHKRPAGASKVHFVDYFSSRCTGDAVGRRDGSTLRSRLPSRGRRGTQHDRSTGL